MVSKIVKFIETESRIEVTWGFREWGKESALEGTQVPALFEELRWGN